MNTPAGIFIDNVDVRNSDAGRGTVLSIIGHIASIQLASGEVLSGVNVTGGAAVGDDVALRYERGQVVALGRIETGGGYASGIVLGNGSGSIGSGLYVPLSRQITTTNGVAGGGTLAADLTLQVDGTVARQGWAVSAGAGLSGGGGLSASGITLTVNQGYAFVWTAPHTFSAGLTVPHGQNLNFGADVALTRFGANVLTTGADDSVRSPNFVSGVAGWTIDGTGDAEFNNIVVRGELRAFVFKINELAATAGTFGVFYSAATTYADFTTPAVTGSSFTFQAKNTDAGAMLLGANDVCRVKAWNGAGIIDAWFTVTARTNNTTHTTYTATLNSGSASATIREGTAIVDYGPNSGTSGFITLSADGTVGSSPNITLATHAGAPWTTITPQMRIGNLNGYGSYATNVYGVVIGNPAGAWIAVETTNGFRIMYGANPVAQVDTTGAFLFRGAPSASVNVGALRWNPSTYVFEGGYYAPAAGPSYGAYTQQWRTDAATGAIVAGGGNVVIGAGGIALAGQIGGWTASAALTFSGTNAQYLGLGAFQPASTPNLTLQNVGSTNYSTVINITSYAAGTGVEGTINIRANSNAWQSKIDIGALAGIKYHSGQGRHYFTDSELSTGNGLRVGAVWSMYGIYAESGYCAVGGASGVNLQNGVVQITSGVGVLRSPVNTTDRTLAVNGGISTEGAYSGLILYARDDSDTWLTYASGDNYRIWYGGSDMVRVDVLGRAWQGNNSSSWSTTSDARIKHVRGDYHGGLAEILRIRPVEYEFNGRGGFKADSLRRVGVIAQEIRNVLPDTVYSIGDVDDIENMLAVDPSEIVWALVNAVKELAAQIKQ